MKQDALGVILDVDGTLIDSNEARAQAWVEALKEHGHAFHFAELRPLVGLAPGDVTGRLLGFGEDTPFGQMIRDRYHQIFRRRYLPRTLSFLRAHELLGRIRDSGLKIAVASTDPPELLLPLLRILGAEALIHRAAHPTKSPSAPLSNRDLLKSALDRLGLPAARAVVLCDAPFDIDAAVKLGAGAVALRTGPFKREELAGALATYANAADLYDNFDGSPLAGPLAGGRAA